ncbi:hypothetical protein PRZ48_012155 [Zasmidium cellare]|uniref:ABC transporter n=1 Tax=Zasmidium cellare TaxID=395010 RepID=A0ABR0E423_ZASCE|nr:hypothetical protein PRZ48_012155 [Zasmidium cellare]
MSDSEKSVDGMSPAPNDRNRIEKPVLDDEGKERDSINPNDAAGSEKGDGEEKKDEEKKSGLKDYIRIFAYADKWSRALYGAALVGAIASGAALPVMTLAFGSGIRNLASFQPGQSSASDFTSSINGIVLYFVYLFAARFAIGYFATLCICMAAARTTNSLRKAFLSSLLRQGIAHFDETGNGSAAAQITTNGNRINQGIAEKLFTAVAGISMFFAAYIVALSKQWKLALIAMSILPAIFGTMAIALKIDAPLEARVVKIYSRAAEIAHDALASIKSIRAFGAEKKVGEWYDDYLKQALVLGKKKCYIYASLLSSQTFMTISGTALAFWQGHSLFVDGEIDSVGTVFTVVLAVTLGASSVLQVLPQVTAITNASSAAAELFSVIDKPSAMDPLSPAGDQPEVCQGEIAFRNVGFAYPTRPNAPVLQGLDLSIPAGKTTAIVGPSGCGKSTIVGLLEKWYQPTSGSIILDGRDILDCNTKWLRNNIRLVQQEPTLFEGSVFENVAKGLVNRSSLSADDQMALVQEACKSADAHSFVERLPQGYHTQLGEAAGTISGGQRQRLSIARSIISEPKVLVCDEATSALDPRAEQAVQDALDRVSAGKTTIVIAHKLKTVMKADSIAVMSDGRVVEQGSHRELVERDGLYAAMVRAQDLGADARDQIEEQNIQDEKHEGEPQDDSRPALFRAATSRRTTKSSTSGASEDDTTDYLTKGTLNMSLVTCIARMLWEHKDLYWWYALTASAYLIVGGTYPAQSVIFARYIQDFEPGNEGAALGPNFWALMVFVLALANFLGYFGVGLATNTVGQILTYRYRLEMLRRMLDLDQDFYDCPDNSSGVLASQLSSIPSQVQELMSTNLGLMFNLVVNVTSTGILAIAFGWKLGLTLVFTGLFLIVGSGYIRIRLDQRLEATTAKQASSSSALGSEAVRAIRTVSLLTLEDSVLSEYSYALDSVLGKTFRSLVFTLIPYAFSQSAEFLVIGLGLWYGAKLVARGEYSVTQFFVIFLAIIFGDQAAAQFFTYTTSITKAKPGANFILWLRTIAPKIREDSSNSGKGPRGDGAAVGVNNVHFRYRQRASTKVLQGISMQIPTGGFVAFVGPSGCGKSTVISLLERFYDPTSGTITLNDDDISSLSPKQLRAYLSLVQQEPPLYLGSVRDNITLGLDHEATEEEVLEACRQANAYDFVTSLPEGLNTPCGSKGLQFSGGQRQRIAVARALIRKPKLLLLDEATSALDTHSERLVQQSLDEAAQDRTTVAVAHRLSTVRNADVIFVVEDGKIAEQGTHDELFSLRGRYHAMCLAQSLDRA